MLGASVNKEQNRRMTKETMKHQKRIDTLYQSHIHKLSLRQISQKINAPYSTVRHIIQEYINDQRTNKLLDLNMKAKILEDRC